MPGILVLKRLRQEDCEFKATLDYVYQVSDQLRLNFKSPEIDDTYKLINRRNQRLIFIFPILVV